MELPQEFPHGLRVLVIDDDNNFLKVFETMCLQFHYRVTTCSKASDALKTLKENKSCFDVIVIKDQMQDMDSYNFLKLVSQEIKIPVIVMCVDDSLNTTLKAIAKGACECWIKPLNVNQIKMMWQHVARNYFKEKEKQEINKAKLEDEGKKRGRDEWVEMDEVEKNKDEQEPPIKKARVVWSEKLHQQFLSAVTELGGVDKAVPRKIVEMMKDARLTREHVASHLQKYRIYLKVGETKKKRKNHQNGSSSEFDFQAYAANVEVQKQKQNQNYGIFKSTLWSNNLVNDSQTKQDPIAYGCINSQEVVAKKKNDECGTWIPVTDQPDTASTRNIMWNNDMEHHQTNSSMMVSGTNSYIKEENVSPDSVNDQMNYDGAFETIDYSQFISTIDAHVQNTQGESFFLDCDPLPQPLPISSFPIGASCGFSPLYGAGLFEMESNAVAEEALNCMYG